MAKPAQIAHIVYSTRNFDAMIAWYREVFEAEVVYENPAFAFLTYDGEHHRLAFANLDLLVPGGDAARSEVGVNHVAYTFASLGDLLDTYSRLKAAGIEPYWPVHHGMTLSLYYQDPDGNRMEFQVDTCPVEEGRAMMMRATSPEELIGVSWDPDRLRAEYDRGVPPEQLLVQPVGPPSPIPAAHGLT